MAVATLAMMLVYSARLTAIAVAAVAAYALSRAAFYAPLRRATEEHIVHAARQQSHFLETVRGVQSIKLFGRQEERRSRWLNLVVDAANRDLAVQKLSLGFRSANGLVFGVERVAVVWVGRARSCSTPPSPSACSSPSWPTRSSSRRASRGSSTS